jgi:hypothetical protein
LPKYIEIKVPDSFDDTEQTTFDALDCAVATYPASPVSQGELLAALKDIETSLRENLVWLADQLDLNFRRYDRETIGRLEQLATSWDYLCEVIAEAEGKEIDIAHEASAELRQWLKQSVGRDHTGSSRIATWFVARWRTLRIHAVTAVRRVARGRRGISK